MKPNIIEKSKLARRRIFARHLATMPPTPCGCVLRLAACDCHPNCCVCAAEFDFCEHSGDWPIEYVARVGDLLAKMDPGNYAEPPPPTSPVMLIGHEQRMAFYEARLESGFGIWHPGDCKPEKRKNGGLLATGRNGSVRHAGTGSAPETMCRSRWRGRGEMHAYADAGGGVNVEDLVAMSER